MASIGDKHEKADFSDRLIVNLQCGKGGWIASTLNNHDPRGGSLYDIDGNAMATVGERKNAKTSRITSIYLNEKSPEYDEFGIRVDKALKYSAGDKMTDSGSFKINLGMENFHAGVTQ